MSITETKINKMLDTNSHKWDNKIAFSVAEISEMLGLPTSTIANLCRKGKISAFKVGRHYRISRAEIYSYITEQQDKAIIL